MKIGIIGLGKMGLNLALNAKEHDFDVVGFDVSTESVEKAKKSGLNVSNSIEELVENLDDVKVVMLSLPAGKITNEVVNELSNVLKRGDVVIDSGNSNYKDSLINYQTLKEKEIFFLDCGTSGGMSGARNGACLMIGGDQEAFDKVKDFFEAIAIEDGCLFVNQPSAGHYLKMVHNGVEYGMMQAIGEGFNILEHSDFNFNHEKVAKVWNNGSVIRSWLMELAQEAFRKDPKLERIEGVIGSNGEAKWTLEEALRLGVPTPVIADSLFVRNSSCSTDEFSNKLVSSLRNEFGGHEMKMK